MGTGYHAWPAFANGAFSPDGCAIMVSRLEPRPAARFHGKERDMGFTLLSDSFKDGDYPPDDFISSTDFCLGCAGRNSSPHLKWSEAPAGTKSAAVTASIQRRDRLGTRLQP